MKKHLHNSLRALFLSLAVLLSLPMLAVEVEIEGINYDLNAEAKQAAVIKKSSGTYSGEVVIPESVEHEGAAYSVTSIVNQAFAYCYGLTLVTIPNSVTSIGKGAFRVCRSLTSVHISDIAAWCNIDFGDKYSNPLYFAQHLYLNGEEVKDLVIPNSVTSIGGYAFYDCSGLTSVTIPNSVTSIGGSAFSGCSGLTSVTIPYSVTSIGSEAFRYCNNLKTVLNRSTLYFSKGSTDYGYVAYYANIVVNNYDGQLGDFYFANTNGTYTLGAYTGNDTELVLPEKYKESNYAIGFDAFYRCSSLTSVVIPNSVTSIGDCAFYNCSGLTSVEIGNSVTSIGGDAFSGCSGLTSVTIPNSVTSIGYAAFRNCPDLLDVYCYAEKVPSTDSYAFDGSYPEYATLHVPAASIDSYKASEPWNSFGKIVALTPEETGIGELKGGNGKVKTAVYDLSGRRVQKAQKGIFVQNGKVMVK